MSDVPELLMSTEELAGRLDDPRVRVVDVRWNLDDSEAGEQAHREAHIPGAVYLHWLRDLSDPDESVEGQLAPPERFANVMSGAGIGDGTLVVAYDDNEITMAARLVWALHERGHPHARVLNGGWPKWLAESRPTESGPVSAPLASFTPRPGQGLRLTKADMLARVEAGDAAILDCRMDRTYLESGAHIPGARRLPAPTLLTGPRGTFADSASVAARLREQGIKPRDEVALYCGGGVSASAAYVALRRAGYGRARVYDGSWAEWGANPDTPKEPHDRSDPGP